MIYISSIKTELAINVLKNFCTWQKKGLDLKGLKKLFKNFSKII